MRCFASEAHYEVLHHTEGRYLPNHVDMTSGTTRRRPAPRSLLRLYSQSKSTCSHAGEACPRMRAQRLHTRGSTVNLRRKRMKDVQKAFEEAATMSLEVNGLQWRCSDPRGGGAACDVCCAPLIELGLAKQLLQQCILQFIDGAPAVFEGCDEHRIVVAFVPSTDAAVPLSPLCHYSVVSSPRGGSGIAVLLQCYRQGQQAGSANLPAWGCAICCACCASAYESGALPHLSAAAHACISWQAPSWSAIYELQTCAGV